ncbi:MAG: ADP-ribosylglycohydrolase family protein [Clostridiales bacterium]|nr:ADP-ribosylglycohydrolase family protein [Clostridiales bacterium]
MSKIYDGIMGLVVGDALGVPVEFKQRDTFKVTDMVGYGTYNQPPGTWSDDSSMTLATVESIGRLGRIDVDDIMKNFSNWYYQGDFTPYGEVFDVGNATAKAIQRYNRGVKPLECGGKSIFDNGNGALMRILPLAFVSGITQEEIINVAHLTHAHEISTDACLLYTTIAQAVINWDGNPKRTLKLSENFSRVDHIMDFSRDEIKSTGYVVDTLEAALWCLYNTDNYKDCVLTAVNLGDDTDTVAAVVGGLAGIFYGCGGEKGIPEEWISQIARKEWIKELCEKLQMSNVNL